MRDCRGQSEVIGVVLLIGVVVSVVMLVGAVVLSNSGSSQPEQLADIEISVNTTAVTLTHNGGDDIDTEDIAVILKSDSTDRRKLATFDQVRGTDTASFEPGDEWVGQHSLDGSQMEVTVIHEPSNTILQRESVDVDLSGQVVFAVNSGGAGYTAADGTAYQADTNFDGGLQAEQGECLGVVRKPGVFGITRIFDSRTT